MLKLIKKASLLMAVLALSACMSTSENNVDFSYFISATSTINPDINNRPSPVVVRVYQLTNKLNFEHATYTELFEGENNVLGSEYITLNEYLIHPDTNNEVELQISEHAKYIGVAVGYRSIDMVTWRTVMAVPEGKFWRDAGLEIKVDKLSVRVVEL